MQQSSKLPEFGQVTSTWARRFASALEVIPRTLVLAENAHDGAEGNEIVAQLLANHEKAGGES